jgi:hypothetical protein
MGAEPAERHREGHAVDVAGGARLGRVAVGVGVEPDQADPRPPRAVMAREAGQRAHRDRVVAAQHHRDTAARSHPLDPVPQDLADLLDLLQVLHPGVARSLGLRDLDRQVARVPHLVPELADPLVDVRDPERGGAHVHPAPPRSEVEWNSDQRDARRGHAGRS